MSNNANGNQTSDIFSGIAWYYGDNDLQQRIIKKGGRKSM